MNRNHHNKPQSPVMSVLMGIFAVCFGIFWTVTAARMAPFMAVFGILFIAMALTITINSFKTAKKHQQDNDENEAFVQYTEPEQKKPEELRCPYCNAPIHRDDKKCEYCGSRL